MTTSLTEPLINGNNIEVSPNDWKDVEDVEEKESPRGWLGAELKRQFWLAAPMIVVSLLQYSINVVSVMFVGHLGELALASASIAWSIAGVTGFSLLNGLGSALETLCGQAYGAKQYHLLGIYLQRGIVVLNASSVLIACVWLNMGEILRAMGQDSQIAEYAGHCSRWLIPSLFAFAFLQPLVKFLQTQSAVLPMALCSALTLCMHIPICWLLIYKLGVGFTGAPIANGISSWLNVTFLVVYIKFGSTCKQTWAGFTSEAFHDMVAFFKLAIPSAAMICLEYWSFELMVLLSGLLPNPELELSSFALCLNTIAVLYLIPNGLSACASTRVANELGAGRASAAQRAVVVSMSLAMTEGLVMATVTFSSRRVWPYAFTNEAEVVDYVANIMPYLSVVTIMDSCQGVLSGVIRGCGNQKLGAYSNLAAYYGVGVPLAVVLAFHYHLNGRGLWIGFMAALAAQATGLLLVTMFTDWEKQAQKALDRVYADELPTDNIVIHNGLCIGLMAALTVQGTGLLLITIFTEWEKQAQKALDRVYVDQLPTDNIVIHKDDCELSLICQD